MSWWYWPIAIVAGFAAGALASELRIRRRRRMRKPVELTRERLVPILDGTHEYIDRSKP